MYLFKNVTPDIIFTFSLILVLGYACICDICSYLSVPHYLCLLLTLNYE